MKYITELTIELLVKLDNQSTVKWNTGDYPIQKTITAKDMYLAFNERNLSAKDKLLNGYTLVDNDVFLERVKDYYPKKQKALKKIRTYEDFEKVINLEDSSLQNETFTKYGLIITIDKMKYLVDASHINLTSNGELLVFGEEYLNNIGDELENQLKEFNYTFIEDAKKEYPKVHKALRKIKSYEEFLKVISRDNTTLYHELFTEYGLIITKNQNEFLVDASHIHLTPDDDLLVFGKEYLKGVHGELKEKLLSLEYK